MRTARKKAVRTITMSDIVSTVNGTLGGRTGFDNLGIENHLDSGQVAAPRVSRSILLGKGKRALIDVPFRRPNAVVAQPFFEFPGRHWLLCICKLRCDSRTCAMNRESALRIKIFQILM